MGITRIPFCELPDENRKFCGLRCYELSCCRFPVMVKDRLSFICIASDPGSIAMTYAAVNQSKSAGPEGIRISGGGNGGDVFFFKARV